MAAVVRQGWLLAVVLALPVTAPAQAPSPASLLEGVTEIVAPGAIPGPIAVFGGDAVGVMVGRQGQYRLPLVAAATYGRGRVVAIGHEGFFSEASLRNASNQRLLANLTDWLAGRKQPVRLAAINLNGVAATWRAAGRAVTEVPAGGTVAALPHLDLVGASAGWLSGANDQPACDAVAAWVEQGGGLLLAGCPWGWQQLNPTRDIRVDLGGNRILARMGLAFVDAMVDRTGQDGWTADPAALADLHAGQALDVVAQPGGVTDKRRAGQLGAVLTGAMTAVPPTDTLFLPRVTRLLEGLGEAAVPSDKTPVAVTAPLARLAIIRRHDQTRGLPPEQVRADPSAAAFPGAVPAEAPRVTRELTIDTAVPAWHSTGLYAAPGEIVTVTIPEAAAKARLALRIGCHTDRLWHLDSWRRVPEITRSARLTAVTTQVASPFGGLVYVDVPADCKLGRIGVAVANVVEAPLYEHGVTTLRDWRDRVRHLPGPWAELATRKVVITVPATVVRALDDPEALMGYWDRVLDCAADLAGRSRERERPERYVADVQISAGYMHSGYPIMTWLDAPPRFVDWKLLTTKGDWGMFHEMGHNHQSGAWTFDGAGEVTVNLFTLYILERASHVPVAGGRVFDPKFDQALADYLAKGAPFETWKSNPFLALRMYAQLQQTFGWGAFERVFRAYRDAPADQLPKTDQDKRDQWLIRFSREVNRNLGPFFERWGVPTTEAARQAVADLPAWDFSAWFAARPAE